MSLLRHIAQRAATRNSVPVLKRHISSGEKPAIIHERLRTMAAETEAKTEKRMGWLKLGTMWGVALAGGYCVLFQEFKDIHTGEDYEHCFMPIRRVYKQGMDFVMGMSDAAPKTPSEPSSSAQ